MNFLQFIETNFLDGLSDRKKYIAMHRTKDVFGIGENQKTYRELGLEFDRSVEIMRQDCQAAQRRINSRIGRFEEKLKAPVAIVKIIEKEESLPNLPIVSKPIWALCDMSVRSVNALKFDGIDTVDKLVRKTESELLRTPNFGRKSLNEIKHALRQHGLTLGM